MLEQRIAIYARYSSDLQKPTSIDDQNRLCCDLVSRHFPNAKVVAVFGDAAVSGTTMNRPGLSALLDGVRMQEFDMVVAEGLDRISRDLADIASIHKVLNHYRVTLWTNHEGVVADLHIGLKGTMNALFVKDLRSKIKRGQQAQAEAGRVAGGNAYGYRVVKGVLDEKGKYIRGLREIDDSQAVIVRRIFKEYARGVGTRTIVRSLNHDGIPGPTGGNWSMHTLHGGAKRGGGILKNNLYRGWLLYNRMRKVVDPETERQRYELNPEDEWTWTAVPNLRIVDDPTWDAVQERLGGKRLVPNVNRRTKVSKKRHYIDGPARIHALTGLVSCGWCGGKKSIASDSRYVCNTYRYYEKRCKNARGTREAVLIQAVYSRLNQAVMAVQTWPKRLANHFQDDIARAEELQSEIPRINHRIRRLLKAVEFGVQVDNSLYKIRDLETRLAEINAVDVPSFIPKSNRAAQGLLKAALAHMESHFDNRKEIAPIRAMLDLVVADVKLTPRPDAGKGETVDITLKPAGWPEFYRQIDHYWPHLLKEKKSRRPLKAGGFG